MVDLYVIRATDWTRGMQIMQVHSLVTFRVSAECTLVRLRLYFIAEFVAHSARDSGLKFELRTHTTLGHPAKV